MSTIQKVSALKAPIIISTLRQELRTVKAELRELKKDHNRRFKSIRKHVKRADLVEYLFQAKQHERDKAIAARKSEQIRKLFDFRKRQNLDEIKAQAYQIIHS